MLLAHLAGRLMGEPRNNLVSDLEAVLLPHPDVLAGKLRTAVVPTASPLRSHPISTLSDSVFPAPVSLFGDL